MVIVMVVHDGGGVVTGKIWYIPWDGIGMGPGGHTIPSKWYGIAHGPSDKLSLLWLAYYPNRLRLRLYPILFGVGLGI